MYSGIYNFLPAAHIQLAPEESSNSSVDSVGFASIVHARVGAVFDLRVEILGGHSNSSSRLAMLAMLGSMQMAAGKFSYYRMA
jgi:hypothetical protein